MSLYDGIMYLVILGAFIIHLILRRSRTELRSIPGPILASVTNLWRFWTVWNHRMPQRSLELHRKYGPLVRLGPRYVSASSKSSVHLIYKAGTGFSKSDVYGMLQPQLDGTDLHNLFSTQDKKYHATLKRNLAALYSQKGVMSSEPHIDKMIKIFIDKLTVLSSKGPAKTDMSAWLQYWAFDTIGQINMSEPFGFLEEGKDFEQLCAASHKSMRYFGLMGQVSPSLEKTWRRLMSIRKSRPLYSIFERVLNCVDTRSKEPRQSRDKLDAFLALSQDRPDHFGHRDVVSATLITLVTAHDVLAITLRGIMYFLAKHPQELEKLKAELKGERDEGRFSSPVQYAEVADLTYLNAVITETLRIHPSTGLIFERVVPAGGVKLHSHFLPGGTIIGTNAWVFNREPSIFGADSDDFRPERWIECSADEMKEMKKWLLSFGVGSRACIGRHMAIMEAKKLIAELYTQFDFTFENTKWEWTFDGSWLTAQGKMDMLVARALS